VTHPGGGGRKAPPLFLPLYSEAPRRSYACPPRGIYDMRTERSEAAEANIYPPSFLERPVEL